MKKVPLSRLCFIVLAVLQLAAPLYMAWRWEDILATGRRYLWVTAPVDPYDVLKGRYVDLGFREAKGPITDGAKLESGQTAYASIAAGADGHAVISGVSAKCPAGDSYVKVRVRYVKDNTAYVALPFKRYYMEETLAPAAEQAYRERAGQDGVVSVRIKGGYGVIEQLYIGDQTIYEYLRGKK